jgi:hypothetical protein
MGNTYKYLSRSLLTNPSSGVGFGICQRLLSNFLALEQPIDSFSQPSATPGDNLPCSYAPCTRLTIVMACRSRPNGEDAREKLLKKLDKEIGYRSKKGSPEQIAHYKKFRETVQLHILPLELSRSSSVLDFCDMVQQRYMISCVTLVLYRPLYKVPICQSLDLQRRKRSLDRPQLACSNFCHDYKPREGCNLSSVQTPTSWAIK